MGALPPPVPIGRELVTTEVTISPWEGHGYGGPRHSVPLEVMQVRLGRGGRAALFAEPTRTELPAESKRAPFW